MSALTVSDLRVYRDFRLEGGGYVGTVLREPLVLRPGASIVLHLYMRLDGPPGEYVLQPEIISPVPDYKIVARPLDPVTIPPSGTVFPITDMQLRTPRSGCYSARILHEGRLLGLTEFEITVEDV